MKMFSVFCLAIGLAGDTLGQGHFAFRNRVQSLGVDAPVFDTDCATRLQGDAFVSQVYAGTTADQLLPSSVLVSFGAGLGAGYMISDVDVYVPGSTEGQIVYGQMRVWEARGGPTYESAAASGAKHGFSNIFTVRASVPPGPTEFPSGVESFCLVPEPPVWVLAVLGSAAAFLNFRHRKRKSQ